VRAETRHKLEGYFVGLVTGSVLAVAILTLLDRLGVKP
jgi:hypothetical protein